MTAELRETYREIRRSLTRDTLHAQRVLAAAYAEARRVEGRIPNAPPARAERRRLITKRHRGEV